MQRVLGKRILRDLKENCVRYLALGVMIILCMYIIISLIGTADTIIIGSKKSAERNCLEDGQFSLAVPLSDAKKRELTGKGITLEEQFYLDYVMEDESTLRIFQNRKNINLVEIVEGSQAKTNTEIVIERRYADEHDIRMGDSIKVGDNEFLVAGIGCSPDYDAPYKNFTDSSVNSMQFGTAFITKDAYKKLLSGEDSVMAEEYVCSYRLNGVMSEEELKEMIEWTNLRSFLKAKDNPRIMAASEDQIINKYSGILAGGIVLILFAYVISVFVVYGIEKENTTIGALYALGVKQKELILHYLCLPVLITFVSGVIGCIIGFVSIGNSPIMGSSYSYFSIPQMESVYLPYLIMYGVVLPPVLSSFVNWFVIRKKLDQPPLHMLKNEQKIPHVRQIKLKKMSFVGAFRIRQMIREARTSFTVIGGMFISLLILMLGLNCYVMCQHISEDNKADTKFEYVYTYKYPNEFIPEDGYVAFSKTVKKENLGYNLDVSILGITEDNPFFDVKLTDSKSDVVISSSMAEKYALKKGDVFVVEDEEAKMYYAFMVNDIVQYSTNFHIFMNIECMREMFGESDTYYNQVFSDKELNIEADRLYGITTKKDIEKSADVFMHQMMPMIIMLTVFSSFIFAVVMYLMMKVMIERCAFHISMVKVFGYRTKEIRKLYLDGNFYIVAIGAAICIPLAKLCMDFMYPLLVSNVACGINTTFSWQMYMVIYAAVLLVYFVINGLLTAKLKKVNLAEVLKNRE